MSRADVRAVIEALERRRVAGRSALAFDADGTLWAGDVGEDTFEYATEHELLREEAREGVERVAAEHSLDTRGSPSRIAARIFAAYQRGEVNERLTCEVMTWAYAGHTEDELRELAESAFRAKALPDRVRRVLEPVLSWADRERAQIAVISASPRVVVETALRFVGISVESLAAGRPRLDGAKIAAEMAEPLPYGPAKRTVGERLLGGSDWLASFGDNAFDVDMLRAARVAVAVHPKPALLARLSEVPGVLVLE